MKPPMWWLRKNEQRIREASITTSRLPGIRAHALAAGAPRLVTYAELARVCRGEAP